MTRTGRRGFGIATLSAVLVPALVLVVALAHMFGASTTRRVTGAAFASYLAGEITESAIAEAAHRLSVTHLFPGAAPATFTTAFVEKMLADQSGVPEGDRAYFALVDESGQELSRMLVAMAFEAPAVEVPLGGAARAAAEANAGVRVLDMRVTVRPVSFRREFLSARGAWVNWGVVAFSAEVRLDDGTGPATHRQDALKLFSLRPSGAPGETLVFSDRNLRTVIR